MMRWSHLSSNPQPETHNLEPLTFQWKHVAGGTVFTAHPPSSEAQAESLRARLFSHYIVDLMPEAAVMDLLEEVVRVWDDYQAVLSTPLPAPVKQQRVLKGRVRARYERPTFAVVEE